MSWVNLYEFTLYVHYEREIRERRFYSQNASMFSVHTTSEKLENGVFIKCFLSKPRTEKFENATMTGYFWFVFGDSDTEIARSIISYLIRFEKLRLSRCFRPH